MFHFIHLLLKNQLHFHSLTANKENWFERVRIVHAILNFLLEVKPFQIVNLIVSSQDCQEKQFYFLFVLSFSILFILFCPQSLSNDFFNPSWILLCRAVPAVTEAARMPPPLPIYSEYAPSHYVSG